MIVALYIIFVRYTNFICVHVVGPETVSVTWASQVFRWLYSDLVIVNELLGAWVQALNDYNKKSLEEVREESF